ncbi:MAG TPA: transketolase C-terminal domain-containing protein [Anaerolineales bacterium]|nr:transketolase C-terminal domain-containing protein [Anaerolineales bacterium]
MPTVLESLNLALHQALTDNDTVYVLGEDILDPYGGAFKVTRGLSTRYPERVITTPISEAGFVGVAAGMAMRGLRPVVEIMFGDFTTLIADQLINHITKFRWMYNEQVSLPMIIRTPMGGRRGYGPTHSQTLEKLFLGVPGLRVVAPAAFCRLDGSGGPGDLLYRSILETHDPILFIENKLQYYLPVWAEPDSDDFTLEIDTVTTGTFTPAYSLTIRGAPDPTLTITAYGYMAELAKQAVSRLAYEHEIFARLVVPTQLSPFMVEPILCSVKQTKALLLVEEGTLSLGWGAEVIARLSEAQGLDSIRVKRLAAKDVPVPASGPLEANVLPGVDQIIQSAIGTRL